MSQAYDFDKAIRKVPDFPKKGILFYDITSLVADPKALRAVKAAMISFYKDKKLSKIVSVESRGFLFAPLLAEALEIPLVLARKKGKLPNPTHSQSYELEYGSDHLEIQKVDIDKGERVLIIDDLIATGGTLKAVCQMIEGKFQAEVVGLFAIIGLPFLNYEKTLAPHEVHTLINYDTEHT
ncbi:MAG: adenine phosphoribosyltransferase [Spirochaetia bacterium]|nr:adenine phosphoribosyltransferase [Spirochaetia bacterium]